MKTGCKVKHIRTAAQCSDKLILGLFRIKAVSRLFHHIQEVTGATMIEIRARYEDWVQGKATEKANWVGPDFGKKAEE